MPHVSHNYTQLPRKLQKELEISTDSPKRISQGRSKVKTRKELRRDSRAGNPLELAQRDIHASKNRDENVRSKSYGSSTKQAVEQESVDSISKKSKQGTSILRHGQRGLNPGAILPLPELSRRKDKKIAQEDARIEALENLLGSKGNSKAPKSFQDDGLDSILAGLDDVGGLDELNSEKRKRVDDEEWIKRKRLKGQNPTIESESAGDSDFSEQDVFTDDEEDDSVIKEDGAQRPSRMNLESTNYNQSAPPAATLSKKRQRENPFVVPGSALRNPLEKKYVPPSLRSENAGSNEVIVRLNKQIKGLLNRLSESNVSSIVLDIERLYQAHPRHNVSSSLIQILKDILSDPASLQDTFIILHSGFIAALYKVLGTEFGALVIECLFEEFNQIYTSTSSALNKIIETTDKRLLNLIQTFAELFNLSVIASNLIYDLVRFLLSGFSDLNTELLLRLLRACGSRLRQDDSNSLKIICLQLKERAAQAEEGEISIRTKFMIETIEALQKPKSRTSIADSAVSAGHRIAMKKTLGSLNQRSIKASEPLRFGISDLQNADKRGKWWLVGATFRDEDVRINEPDERPSKMIDSMDSLHFSDTTPDLLQLAREQRMNTDIRRSIFVAIMSADDYNDAYLRLGKLRLRKSQELEIPKVLIHCVSVEKTYNPFYTFLCRRFCADHKLRMALQFALWDIFKQLGEGENALDKGSDDEDEDGERKLGLRSLVNLGKMYGNLIGDEGLSLGVLKVCQSPSTCCASLS